MKRLVAVLFLVPLCLGAQTSTAKSNFRDKVIEAIQNADLIETTAPDFEYTIERLDARHSINAATRAISSPSERKIAAKVRLFIERKETCHITRATLSPDDFSKCLEEADAARTTALALLGIDPKTFYPQP